MRKDPAVPAQQPRIQRISVTRCHRRRGRRTADTIQQMRWQSTVRRHWSKFPSIHRMAGETVFGRVALCQRGGHLELGLQHVRTVRRRTAEWAAKTEIGRRQTFRGVRLWSATAAAQTLGHHGQRSDEAWLLLLLRTDGQRMVLRGSIRRAGFKLTRATGRARREDAFGGGRASWRRW